MTRFIVSPRRARAASLLVAIATLLLVGCDTEGLYPLGARRDTLVPCDGPTTTWLRSTNERTEVLVLGALPPLDPANPIAAIPPETPTCFAYGWVAHDTSAYLEAGSYWVASTGVGIAAHNDEYEFDPDTDTPILSRRGATKRHRVTPLREPITLRMQNGQLLATYRGETHVYTSIGEVADSIDTSTMTGAEDAFSLVNVPLFTSLVRVPGFGSGRMTQYVGLVAEFQGLIRNRLTVQVASLTSPKTDIIYYQFEDLTGITLDGVQVSDVNISGAGPMRGTVSFVVLGEPNGVTPRVSFRGSLVYDDVRISNGAAGGGTFTLNIDGEAAPYVLPYTIATDIDLRRVLPVQTP